MNRLFIRKHKLTLSIVVFIMMYGILNIMKPSIIYNKDGSLREFGINQKSKTVLPMWAFVICLSVVSYLSVSFYLMYPRITKRLY